MALKENAIFLGKQSVPFVLLLCFATQEVNIFLKTPEKWENQQCIH